MKPWLRKYTYELVIASAAIAGFGVYRDKVLWALVVLLLVIDVGLMALVVKQRKIIRGMLDDRWAELRGDLQQLRADMRKLEDEKPDQQLHS